MSAVWTGHEHGLVPVPSTVSSSSYPSIKKIAYLQGSLEGGLLWVLRNKKESGKDSQKGVLRKGGGGGRLKMEPFVLLAFFPSFVVIFGVT